MQAHGSTQQTGRQADTGRRQADRPTVIKVPTYWPDPPPGRAPVEPGLLVLHGIGVDGNAPHIGGRDKPAPKQK